ncbi:hypothetical protein ACA910_001629 [Epithemia clementina (nom. ined.)]
MIALRTLIRSGGGRWRTLDIAATSCGRSFHCDGILSANAAKATVRTRTRKSSLTTKTYQVFKSATAEESVSANGGTSGTSHDNPDQKKVPVVFVEENPDGSSSREIEVQAVVGKHLLDAAHSNNVELEGACGGELACSTCHLVFEQEVYDKLPPKTEEEEDMLDLAFAVTETSRLGCQIPVKEEYAGMKLRIPNDGFGSEQKAK